jgi:nitrogen-specific signal transduction histidine kinase/ActR/RegA family two-component response regulator
MLGSHVDVTERKLLEEQMRQAQKVESIGRLAGGVAHDFNNLLSAILGFTELARDSVPPDSSAAHSLARIVEAANRGGKLTQQLLAFARKKIVKPEVLNLNQVVMSMENLLRRLIGEDLDLVLAPSAAPATVKVDRGSFEQVIMNLAVNARDAMPTGGKLTIETSQVELGTEYAASHADVQPGHYIMLAVSDTGTGIPEHHRAQIFEPFYTTKPIGQGTGLGLAMCHGIVKQAGGHIDVYSEVGKGTSFKIYMPLTEQTADAARPVYTPAPQKGGLETVLFVEDELLMLEIAQQFLTSLGYKFIGAKNGQEALTKVKALQEPIHILVTDVIMPKMGGTELAAKMLELFPGIKVLYSSGYTDNAIVNHGILQENIHFLQKPYTPSVLAGKIRQVLDEKQDGLSKK